MSDAHPQPEPACSPPTRVELSSCVVHLHQQQVVTHDGAQHRLTTREAALLGYLIARPSTPVSREALLEEVWGYAPSVRSRACDNAMNRLREKVELDPKRPAHLLTEFGTGYRFEPLTAAAAPPPSAEPVAPPEPSAPALRLTACSVDVRRR